MINNKGELIRSIPSICINYKPIMNNPTKVKCETVGILYVCEKNKKGCPYCKNRKDKNIDEKMTQLYNSYKKFN